MTTQEYMENHLQIFKDHPLSFSMIAIEGGTFDMGSDDSEAFDREKPVHSVSLTNYWMGEYLVTQALWAYVMQDTDMPDPSNFKGANRPVEQVSWNDINDVFLPKLNKMTEGIRPKGTLYRLPTEAEWEYAARGGKYWKEFSFKYAGSDKLNEVGWYYENSHEETKPVGLKMPNLLGLYDMSGNVWEWCSDKRKDYEQNYEEVIRVSIKDPLTGALINPSGVTEGQNRVYRGGSWIGLAQFCRPTNRNFGTPADRGHDIGFRLVLSFPSV